MSDLLADKLREAAKEAVQAYGEFDRKLTEQVLSTVSTSLFEDANQTSYRVVYAPPAQCTMASYPQEVRVAPVASVGAELLAAFRLVKELAQTQEAKAALDRYIDWLLLGGEGELFYAALVSSFVLKVAEDLAEIVSAMRELVDMLAKPVVCLQEAGETYMEQLDRALSEGDFNLQITPTGLGDSEACRTLNAIFELFAELGVQLARFGDDPVAFLKEHLPHALQALLLLIIELDLQIIQQSTTPQEGGALLGSMAATIVTTLLP